MASPWLEGASPAACSATAPRFLDRDGPVGQSNCRFAFRHDRKGVSRRPCIHDPFHSLLGHTAWQIFMVFCAGEFLVTTVFAVFYKNVSSQCDLRLQSFLDAFYLSLSIGFTIGWGKTGSQYFKRHHDDLAAEFGCRRAAILILLHCATMVIANSVLIGTLFCRVSSGENRASMVFSSRAVIREISGRLYFMFQVCDQHKHQLYESKVRCYAILTRDAPAPTACSASEGSLSSATFEQRAMRLLQPDDACGGMVSLALPTLVVHEIDAWSPFSPSAARTAFPGIIQRRVDFWDADVAPPPSPSRAEVEAFLSTTNIEVLVLVEGMEATVGNVVQIRYSYVNDDVVWDSMFVPSMFRQLDGTCGVCFDKMHQLERAPPTIDDDDFMRVPATCSAASASCNVNQ